MVCGGGWFIKSRLGWGGGVSDFGFFFFHSRILVLSIYLLFFTSFAHFSYRIIRRVICEIQPLCDIVILLAKVIWFLQIVHLGVVQTERHWSSDTFSLVPDPRFIQIEFGTFCQQSPVQERLVQLNRYSQPQRIGDILVIVREVNVTMVLFYSFTRLLICSYFFQNDFMLAYSTLPLKSSNHDYNDQALKLT